MPVFDDDRYNELVSSAMITAYNDELEKTAIWGSTIGKLAPRVAVGTGKLFGKLAPKATAGAAKRPGLLSRFGQRQLHATGLGKSLKPGASAAEIAAHEKHLADIGIRGAKPIYGKGGKLLPEAEKRIGQEAAKDVRSKWNVPEQVKRLIQGKKYDEAAAIARKAKALETQQAAARQMYELGGSTIPGAARAMVRHPGKVMKAGWKGMPTYEKYMLGGFGGLQAKELAGMEGKTPEEKAEIISRSAVLAPLWLGAGGLSTIPQIATWIGGEDAAVKGAKALARKMNPEQYPETYELTPGDIQAIRRQAMLEGTYR